MRSQIERVEEAIAIGALPPQKNPGISLETETKILNAKGYPGEVVYQSFAGDVVAVTGNDVVVEYGDHKKCFDGLLEFIDD